MTTRNNNKLIETRISDTVQKIVALATDIQPDNDRSFVSITKILWEAPKAKQVFEAAKLCGYLGALFDLGDAEGIKFGKYTEELRRWTTAASV